jgi:uncharacterized protein (DUF302 family)
MKTAITTLAAVLCLSAPTLAGEARSYRVEEPIEDVLFAIEQEIIGRGLKIDAVSHVGDMLARTGADLGAKERIFFRAEVFSFCSATLSREVMQINPANVAFCPYTIFAYTTPDEMDVTHVGHDSFPEGEMQKVEAFLDDIIKTALYLD